MSVVQSYLSGLTAGRESLLARKKDTPATSQASGLSFGGLPSKPDGDFASSLSRTESGGNYGAQNKFGYTGKYQFGQGRLDDYNRASGQHFTTSDLLKSPDLQEQVFSWHVSDIDKFIKANGLDKSGLSLNSMRAVAHLGGKGGLLKFVRSGGQYNPADANGTSLSDYAKTHG